MIVPIKKISIRGPRTELKKTIDVLKSSGAFELSSLNKTETDTDLTDAHKEEFLNSLSRTKETLNFIKTTLYDLTAAKDTDTAAKKQAKANLAVLNSSSEFEYTEFKNIVSAEQQILGIIETIESVKTQNAEINTTLTRNRQIIKELVPYGPLDVALKTLTDTEHTFTLTGTILPESFEKFKSDYDLSNIELFRYQTARSPRAVVILVGHKEDYVIAHKIFSYGFERCKFNYNTTALQKTKELSEQNKELIAEKEANLAKCFIDSKDLILLKTYCDYLTNELDTEEISANTIQGEKFFVLNGWIVAAEEQRIVWLTGGVSPHIRVKTSVPTESDNPPTIVKNNPIISPYGSITNLYSAPGQKDIDPNFFVAIFYFLFFGVMIGDIGYGILMSVIAFSVIMFLKPKKKGTRDLILIIGMGGISAILWGLFFGSFFGADTSSGSLGKIFPGGVLNPIDDAMIFLGLTLGLGVLHIVFGLFLKFYNLLRQGRFIESITDALSRIMLFMGAGIFAITMFIDYPAWVSDIGLWITLGSVAVIALGGALKKKGFFGRLSGAFGALYSLINYLTDILSYARLFGLGLVGAVIASVANTMGGMLLTVPIVGFVFAALVAVLFHAFNLAIGLLSAYVHNARLQFIEFFSKFYQGGGKQFVPMGSVLKYTKIKEVK